MKTIDINLTMVPNSYSSPQLSRQRMEEAGGMAVTQSVAVIACTAMTVLYVAILYTPTLILRLPPPDSFQTYMIRRFICAAISSFLSLFLCSFILPVRNWNLSNLFSAYGIRLDHIWQAIVLPLCLTSLMYAGSLVLKFLLFLDSWSDHWHHHGCLSLDSLKCGLQELISRMLLVASNVSAWRIYIVAPLTEELVFRACMIPLLLCGGFSTYTVVLLSPVFFSLAHLNHFLEIYTQQNNSLLKASMIVGFQLGYTVIFGSFASFLFIRTGHLAVPLVAHVFCNFMGLPVLISKRTGMVTVAFVAGVLGFVCLLFPLTSPSLYNDRTDNCKCWHRYCVWS